MSSSVKSTSARSASSSATPSMSRTRMTSPDPPDTSPPPLPPPPATRASDNTFKPDMPPPSVARRTDADATRTESRPRTASATSAVRSPPALAGSESAAAGPRVAPPSRENSDPGPARARLPTDPMRENSVPTDPRLASRAAATLGPAAATSESRKRSASMSREDSSPELPRRPSMRTAAAAADKTASRGASVDTQHNPAAARAVVPADPRRRSSTSEHPPPLPPPRDQRQSVSESRSSNHCADTEMRESRASSSTTLTSSPAPMPMPPPPPPPAVAANTRPPAARQGLIRLPPMPMVVVEVPRTTLRRKKAKMAASTATGAAAAPPPPPSLAPSLTIPAAPVPGSTRARHAAAVQADQRQRGQRTPSLDAPLPNGDAMQVDHDHQERVSYDEAVKNELDEDEAMELDVDLTPSFGSSAPLRASLLRCTPNAVPATRGPTARASTATTNGTDHYDDGADHDDMLTIPVALAAVMPRSCRALFVLPETGPRLKKCSVDSAIDLVRKVFQCNKHPVANTDSNNYRLHRTTAELGSSRRERCFQCTECKTRYTPTRLYEELVMQRLVEPYNLVHHAPALFGHLRGVRIEYADGTVGSRIPGTVVPWMRDAASAVAAGKLPADAVRDATEPAAAPTEPTPTTSKKNKRKGFSDVDTEPDVKLLRSVTHPGPWDQQTAAASGTSSASAHGPPPSRTASTHSLTPTGGQSRRASGTKASAARPTADVVAVVDVEAVETPSPSSPVAATQPPAASAAAPPVRSLSRAVARRLGQSTPDLAWTPPAAATTPAAATAQPAVPVPSPPPAAAAPSPPTMRLRPGLRALAGARPVQRAKRSGTPAVSSSDEDNDDEDDEDYVGGSAPSSSARGTPLSVVAAAAPGAQACGKDTDSEDEMIGSIVKRVSQARVAAAADARARR
ncbi:hypothetical protein GGF31_001397 [Allomyces arbusculus]|nr:hypothetical protein GGF31_001397 [Allomyces arbusculus]